MVLQFNILGLKSAHGEIVGDLAVKGASLKGGVIAGEQIPLVIDELPMLAALGLTRKRNEIAMPQSCE